MQHVLDDAPDDLDHVGVGTQLHAVTTAPHVRAPHVRDGVIHPATARPSASVTPTAPRRDLVWIRGRHLRYLLVLILDRTRVVMTIPELVEAIRQAGFGVPGVPGKAVSDSLRRAIDHHQVARVERGRYVTNGITKQTRHRYRKRVRAFGAAHRLPDDRGAARRNPHTPRSRRSPGRRRG